MTPTSEKTAVSNGEETTRNTLLGDRPRDCGAPASPLGEGTAVHQLLLHGEVHPSPFIIHGSEESTSSFLPRALMGLRHYASTTL